MSKINILSFIKTTVVSFSLRFRNRFLFLWSNTRRNIWLVFFFFKLPSTLNIRIIPGTTHTNLPSRAPQGNMLTVWRGKRNNLYFLNHFSFFPQEHRLKFAKLILIGSESAIHGICVCTYSIKM